MERDYSVLRFLFGFSAPVGRREYILWGLGLTVLKYLVDAGLIYFTTGFVWRPTNYFLPPPRFSLPAGTTLAMWAWSFPFVWIGVSLTARRAIDAGWSPWVSGLFFLPIVNYILMLTLAVMPTASRTERQRLIPVVESGSTGELFLAAAAGALVIGAVLTLAFRFFLAYGWAMFFGAPFLGGLVAGAVLNRRTLHSVGRTVTTSVMACAVTGGLLLVFSVEGAICLAMALPIAAPLAMFGGIVAHNFALRRTPAAGVAALLLVLPVTGGADYLSGAPQPIEIVSAIEVDAPPAAVWERVVAFPPIDTAPSLLFRLGVASPTSASISGEGVGAMRRCEFSTGAFLEPITRWEPGRHLAFDVVAQPPPLTELSPYGPIHPPHLLTAFRAVRGEFRLIALDGGRRTRLEGSTWYELRIAPAWYWRPMTDAIVRSIHLRVLRHIEKSARS